MTPDTINLIGIIIPVIGTAFTVGGVIYYVGRKFSSSEAENKGQDKAISGIRKELDKRDETGEAFREKTLDRIASMTGDITRLTDQMRIQKEYYDRTLRNQEKMMEKQFEYMKEFGEIKSDLKIFVNKFGQIIEYLTRDLERQDKRYDELISKIEDS